jgi:hypothetical protein
LGFLWYGGEKEMKMKFEIPEDLVFGGEEEFEEGVEDPMDPGHGPNFLNEMSQEEITALFKPLRDILKNLAFTPSGEIVPESLAEFKEAKARILMEIQVRALENLVTKLQGAKVSELTSTFKTLMEKESLLTRSDRETQSSLMDAILAMNEGEKDGQG